MNREEEIKASSHVGTEQKEVNGMAEVLKILKRYGREVFKECNISKFPILCSKTNSSTCSICPIMKDTLLESQL